MPAWLRDVPLAHRGLHGPGVPENTLAAFDAARDAGYGVELDVHLSRDQVPVVVHDPTLRRLAGRPDRVGRLTAAELADVAVAGTDQTVPSLAGALDRLGDAPTMVEVKVARPGLARLAAAVATVLDAHRGPVCVASFHPGVLTWFRRHRPHVLRVLTSAAADQLSLPGPFARRLAGLAPLDRVDPQAVSYGLAGLPNPGVDRWRAAGGTVLAWTVRDDADLARARQVADNVIFETVRP